MGIAVSVALHLRTPADRPIRAYLLAPRSRVGPLQVLPQLPVKLMFPRLRILHLVMHFRMLLNKLPARPERLAYLVDPALDLVLRALLFLRLLFSIFRRIPLGSVFSLTIHPTCYLHFSQPGDKLKFLFASCSRLLLLFLCVSFVPFVVEFLHLVLPIAICQLPFAAFQLPNYSITHSFATNL